MGNPDKIKTSHDNLKVVTADIFNAEELQEHLANQDAVISCLGFAPEKPKTTGYLLATQAIVAAMSSSTTTRPVLDNMRETELWLESECDKKINWTVVRPAGLTNSALSDKEFKVEMDKFDVSSGAGRIARAHVARFMLSCISEEKYHQKGVAVAV